MIIICKILQVSVFNYYNFSMTTIFLSRRFISLLKDTRGWMFRSNWLSNCWLIVDESWDEWKSCKKRNIFLFFLLNYRHINSIIFDELLSYAANVPIIYLICNFLFLTRYSQIETLIMKFFFFWMTLNWLPVSWDIYISQINVFNKDMTSSVPFSWKMYFVI